MKPESDESQTQRLPDDQHDDRPILDALESFRPRPSASFYRKIDGMPWQVRGNADVRRAHRPPFARIFRPRSRAALVFALLSMLFILVYVSTPDGQAAAQRFARFFQRMESDQTPVQVTLDPSTQIPQFDLNLAEAESVAGFEIRIPEALPPELSFHGAAFRPQTGTLTLDYRTPASDQVLRLSQRRLGAGQDFTLVGVSAEVDQVVIGDRNGEYVSGAWKLPLLQASLEEGTLVELEVNWDPEAKIQLLRWQNGDILFQILQIGSPSDSAAYLDKAALIALAESIP